MILLVGRKDGIKDKKKNKKVKAGFSASKKPLIGHNAKLESSSSCRVSYVDKKVTWLKFDGQNPFKVRE